MNNLLLAGEAIDLTYNDGAGTLTLTAERASSSNLGVAKFNADYFTVDGAGDVIVHEVNGGTY